MKSLFSSKIWNIDLAVLLLRIFMGGFMALAHGWGKFGKWSEIKNDFATPLGFPDEFVAGFAIFAELFCALLIVVGLLTRLATIPLIITMAVAAFVIHAGDPLEDREGALTYMGAFLAIFIIGPGKYSIDHLIFKGNSR